MAWGRRLAAAMLGATLAACSGSGVSTPGNDAAMDRTEGTADAVGVPDHGEADGGFDVAAPSDRGVDVVAVDRAVDVAVVRDDGPRDVAVDTGPRLTELPVEPMGVPAPGSECTGDGGVRPGDPTIAPPRPIVPQSVSRVTSQRPSFRWVLPAGTTGARVEVCADRCCTRVITTLDAEGTTVRPTSALPPGVVYWRMFGRAAGQTGSRASYTWEFEVRRRDTPVDSSWGTIRDFTGDGFDDLMFHGPANPDGSSPIYVVEGAPGGPRMARVMVPAAIRRHGPAQPVGDFNGDGRADVAYTSGTDQFERSIGVVESRVSGMSRVARLDVSSVRNSFLSTPSVTDWNGDGYSDVVTTVGFYSDDRLTILRSVLVVYHGSQTGLGAWPQEVVAMLAPINRPWVEVIAELGDLDLDGYGDVHLSDHLYDGPGRGRFLVHGRAEGALRIEVIPDPPNPLGGSYSDAVWVEAVGDLDGDGLGEVTFMPGGGGLIWLYGGATRLSRPPTFIREQTHPGGSVGFGGMVRGADLNGDGFADLVVTAPGSFTETRPAGFPFNGGRVYVYWGARGGLRDVPILFDRTRPADPKDDAEQFGSSIMTPGDLDADGFDDLVVHDLSRATHCYIYGRADLMGRSFDGCIATPGSIGGGF
ncbi:MAG: hypothetical protein JWM10_75 [Myxococcaceae bacterium]|nr:hypothetical protein [Myxococcaceae bacterium]